MKLFGNSQFRRLRRQRGLTLIETALVLAVAAITMGFFVRMLADNAEVMRAKGVSEKMVEVFDAASRYIKVNNSDLVSLPVGSMRVILAGRPDSTSSVPSNSLQATGFLPQGFIDRNSYNQRHALIVRVVNTSVGPRLDAIVNTYGGTKIPDRQLSKIAGFLGASGGYVPKKPLTGDANMIIGSYGGWRSAISNWGSTSNPAEGSVVTTLAFKAGEDGIAPYLYRDQIVGKPEVNAMNTAINMQGHDLNQVGTINAATANVSGNATIGGDASVGRNLVVGIDIWARNVTATGTVQGTNVTATNMVTAPTITGTNVLGTNNVKSNYLVDAPYVTAHNQLTSEGNLNVAGRSDTRDFHTTYFDASNTYIYGIRGIAAGAVRLESLLPKQIAMYSYVAAHGTWVPKPTCPVGSAAKIMVYRQQDSTRGTATVPAFGGTGTADVINAVLATDVGGSWAINWAGYHGPVPGAARYAIAQTFCAYP